MKVKVEVIENKTGKALAKPVVMSGVSVEEVIPMVDETWSVGSTPATSWLVVSKPNCKVRKREWDFGSKFGMRCRLTTFIKEVA